MDKVILKQRVCNHSSLNPDSAALEPTISFRHPGYEDPEDILFKLPRLDSSPQTEVAGVHHRTALLACQIIAKNAFDGYLATDPKGKNRVSKSVALDGILLDETYWFIVDGPDSVYPVVPRFEEWPFPHDRFRTLEWDRLPEINEAERPMPTTSTLPFTPPPTRSIHKRCILSNNPYAVHKAHLVPSAQATWFQANSMRRYGDDRLAMNNNYNTVYVRHDLHTLWDAHIFALVPKRSEFVIHVLNISKSAISEFATEWHNIPVQEGALDGAGKAYLFAKFAQAVFMLFKPFIAYSAVPRYIATIQARTDDPRHPYDAREQWVSGISLGQLYSGGGSRSASASAGSKKRSRSEASANPGDEEEEGKWYAMNACGKLWASESEDEEAEWYEENARGRLWASDSEDDVERGRPRKRRQRRDRSEHTVDTVPSLTDTSAIGEDADLDDGGLLVLAPPSEPRGMYASEYPTDGSPAKVARDMQSFENAK